MDADEEVGPDKEDVDLADAGVPNDLLGDGDEDLPEPPLSFWGSLSEIAGGLLALFLVSVGVLVLYVVGGVFLGLMIWAAPAVLAISAAIILARYLSRSK